VKVDRTAQTFYLLLDGIGGFENPAAKRLAFRNWNTDSFGLSPGLQAARQREVWPDSPTESPRSWSGGGRPFGK